MAKKVAEAMTVDGDNDAVLENARAVMNGTNGRKRASDIGGEGSIKPKRAKKDRQTM